MSTNFFILSSRNGEGVSGPARCCVVEFEDVVIQSLDAQLITVNQLSDTGQSFEKKSFNGQSNILFVIGLTIYDISKALIAAKNQLNSFDAIYAYVFDAFIFDWDIGVPSYKKYFSRYFQSLKPITRLFLPFPQSIDIFSDAFDIPVSYLPLASDVLTHGGFNARKIIDVNGYGRQDAFCSSVLADTFNQKSSQRVYYHTDHMHIDGINNTYRHRAMFWKLLRGSKIALAFDSMLANNEGRFKFSFVGQRWFESTAAGCVVVGKRPTCLEMNELFPIENSTIELPDNQSEVLPFIEALLNDDKKLSEIGTNNYLYALEKNDWRHRLFDLLKMTNLTPPQKLINEIAQLNQTKAQLISVSML